MRKALPESEPLAYTEEVPGIISTQLYSPGRCRELVEYARGAGEWAAAAIFAEAGGGAQTVVRPAARRARSLTFDERTPPGHEFEALLDGLVKPLVNTVWRTNFQTHNSTHIVRYSPGDFYVAHSDIVPGDVYRYFTVLCYLNEDFAGGQTSFPLIGHSITPRAGTAVVFPSSYLHRAEPVVEGEKYVVVTWLCGPPPVRWL